MGTVWTMPGGEPRLRVKPPVLDRERGRGDGAGYAAAYRFRTGHLRAPKRCRACGSVFPGHRCGGPPR